MGRLHYGGGNEPIELHDRALAHLRMLVTSKLRRSESFTVAWRHGRNDADGRSMIWIHCSIPLRFEFDSAEPVHVDRTVLEELAQSAMATGGIDLDVFEPTGKDVTRQHWERAA